MLLRKGVYPYEYIDVWEKFNESSWLEKEDFYSKLNTVDYTEDITDAEYVIGKRVWNKILK